MRQMSTQTLAVLKQFLDDPSARRYGLDLARHAGLKSGTIYPLLARLERDGLLRSAWERIDPVAEGRRPRRYYVLTGEGERVAREALAEARRLLVGSPGLAGGAP
jgi:DNA-binding PadR family transcriptional regulator